MSNKARRNEIGGFERVLSSERVLREVLRCLALLMLATGIMYYILNIEGITIVENEFDPELRMIESLSIEKLLYH